MVKNEINHTCATVGSLRWGKCPRRRVWWSKQRGGADERDTVAWGGRVCFVKGTAAAGEAVPQVEEGRCVCSCGRDGTGGRSKRGVCKALPHKQKAQDVTHLQHAKWRHTLTGRLTPTAKAMCRASTKLLYPLIPYTHKKEALSLNSIDVKASGALLCT